MTLQELWMVIVRRWKLVVAVPVVCLLACGAWLMLSTPDEETYSAKAYIVCNSQAEGVAGLANAEARQLFGDPESDSTEVKVTAKASGATVTVTAEGTDMDEVIDAANQVAENAKDLAVEAYAGWEAPYVGSVELATEDSTEQVEASKKDMLKYLLVALLAGLFVAICIVVVLDMLKRPVKTPEGVQEAVELPVLEILPAQNGERLLANVRFAANRPDVASVLVVPAGDVDAAQTACDLLKSAAAAESGDTTMSITTAKPLSEGMAGAYASRDVDAVVVSARQWRDALPQLESTVAELRLAGANLAGIVFAKGK